MTSGSLWRTWLTQSSEAQRQPCVHLQVPRYAQCEANIVPKQLHRKSWGEYFLDSFLVLSCYKLEMIEVLSGGSDEHTAHVCSTARVCEHTFMWATQVQKGKKITWIPSSLVFGNREVDAVEKQGSCLPLKEDNSIWMMAASQEPDHLRVRYYGVFVFIAL